jgi:hypothetical protein
MWRFMAARAAGSSHTRLSLPCQDRFACDVIEPEWFLSAVADGAGSAPFSGEGAEIAVNAALERLNAALHEGKEPLEAVTSAVQAANAAVIAEAERRACQPRDLASTLLLIAINHDGGAAAQIGDGLIAVRTEEAGWSWTFWPQRGEHVNVTQFLTDADALEAVQTAQLPAMVTDAALMTDGLEPLALHYASRSIHVPFLEGLAPHLRRGSGAGEDVALSAMLESFLTSPRVSARADDDLTLVICTRGGSS